MDWQSVALGAAGVVGGLLAVWLVVVVAMLIARPKGGRLTEAMRLLPDLLRLLTRLSRDQTLPRGVRVRLGLLVAYLALPFDLVPDFIPVLGYADDVIVVVAVLRSVVRRVGVGPLRAHWPGNRRWLQRPVPGVRAPTSPRGPRRGRQATTVAGKL